MFGKRYVDYRDAQIAINIATSFFDDAEYEYNTYVGYFGGASDKHGQFLRKKVMKAYKNLEKTFDDVRRSGHSRLVTEYYTKS